MKNSLICYYWIILFWSISYSLSAQLVVDNTSYTAQDLVENFLIGGGLQVSNVTLGGQTIISQLGHFTNSNSNLGLSEGVLLSTGYAADVITNTNVDTFFTSYSNNCVNEGLCLGGDVDLSNIVGENTFDAAVLEFDFIPTGDTIRFRYVFASEEYNAYACSEFNDLFAFLLTGPGHANSNIAQIPNTSIPVAINTINNGTVGTEGGMLNNCTAPNGSLAHSNLFIDNMGGSHIQYNGMTVVLEAVAAVTPCATYHIKLAVADAVDHFIDSGVFLEANSFTTNGLDVSVDMPDDSTIVEGCNEAIVTVQLFQPIDADLTINYTLQGTATNGIDYNLLPSTITIPSGATQVSFNITPIADMVSDSFETIELHVDISPCSTAVFLIYLREEVFLDTVDSYCVYSNAIGIGIGWNPLPNTTNYEVSIDSGQTWQIANGLHRHVVGNLVPDSTIQFLIRAIGGYTICSSNPIDTLVCSTIACSLEGIVTSLTQIDCFGHKNGMFSYRGNDGTLPYRYKLNNGLLNTNNQFNNLGEGDYKITVIDSNYCSYSDSISIIEPAELLVDAGVDTSIIFGNTVRLNATILSNHSNVSYHWFPNNFLSCIRCSSPFSTPNQSLNYTLTVTNANGCETSDNISIRLSQLRSLFVATGFTPNNDGVNDVLLIQGYDDLVHVHDFKIFDKWGELVFEQHNISPNDPRFGWNGLLNKKPMNPAMFTWTATVEYNDGAVLTEFGQAYLIR